MPGSVELTERSRAIAGGRFRIGNEVETVYTDCSATGAEVSKKLRQVIAMGSTLIPQDRVRAHLRLIVWGGVTHSLSLDAQGKCLPSVPFEMEPGLAFSEQGRVVKMLCWIVGLLLVAVPAWAGDLSVEQIRAALASASPGRPADFSHRSLADLDLSGVDLSGAKLAGADLSHTKLVGAKLVGADLSGALLDFTWIMRADFSQANLSGATLRALVVSTGMESSPAEAARFVESNFSDARMTARFAFDDLHSANFSGARMAADMRNQSMGLTRTDFASANLTGANFSGAELGHVSFRFAKLAGANFSGASLKGADFSGADLTRANFTGADTAGAIFSGATLEQTVGLETK
jgi:uncharacterized protein YjbI with pentapeptide repeats